MTPNRSESAYAAALLSLPGILGVGLLALACVFYFSTLREERQRLDDLREQLSKSHEARARLPGGTAPPTTAAEKLAAFYGHFPRPAELPDMLQRVFAAAQGHGLQLEQGDYRVLTDSAGGLMQYQLTLPVRGSYPQIRKFVDEALASVSTLSLESVQFDRQKVGDAAVDAKVRLILFLGKKT